MIGWDIRNQQVFHSTVDKSHAYIPNILFDDPNDRKYQKVTQNGCQRGDPKSTKNYEKSILGPSRGPLCASLLNLITRMLPKDSHMTENGHLVTLILGSTPKLSGAVEVLQVSTLRGQFN